MITNSAAPSHVFRAALLGRCPACGVGALFAGYLAVPSCCPKCGLDYTGFDPGDGPAVFVVLIVGFLVAGGALIVETNFHPPYWVHAAVWLPAIVILSFTLLRLIKATLMVLQYRHQAHEGRIV